MKNFLQDGVVPLIRSDFLYELDIPFRDFEEGLCCFQSKLDAFSGSLLHADANFRPTYQLSTADLLSINQSIQEALT